MTGVGEDMNTETEDKNGDDASELTKMTGVTAQEKQTENEDDDKTGKDTNKIQDTVNERLMRYQQTPNLMNCPYKAHGLCVAPKLFPIPCQMLGYLPIRFRQDTDLLIHKKANDNRVSKLRPILLFNIEANMHNKRLGREAMEMAEENGGIASK
eukprot:10426141-Ditylum_brightwellii.AAC.1